MQHRVDRRRFQIQGTGRRAGWAQPHSTASLETDAAVTPLGIDDPAPRFTWRLTGPGDIRQLSSQVLVASRADLLRLGAADVWDSAEAQIVRPSVPLRGPRAPCAHPVFLDGDAWSRTHPTDGRSHRGSRLDSSPPAIGRDSGSPGPSAGARSPRPRASPTTRRFARLTSSAVPSAGSRRAGRPP